MDPISFKEKDFLRLFNQNGYSIVSYFSLLFLEKSQTKTEIISKNGHSSKEEYHFFLSQVEKCAPLLLQRKTLNKDGYSQIQSFFFNDNSIICCICCPDDIENIYDIDAYMASNKKEDIKFLENLFQEKIKINEKTDSKEIYILSQGTNGIELKDIGYAAVPIDINNYSEDIQPQINSLIDDLNSDFPSGRIGILEGPPGTGKTFLIRGLIDSVKKSIFIFVPPMMIQSLSGPSLVSSLIDIKSPDTHIVLLCEDADEVLTKRAADNINSVSAMLNLTDGLIGNILDIRIVATTNAKKTEIDPAILRPGRLSQYVHINILSFEQANTLFKKLTGKDEAPNWVEEFKEKEKTIGFQNEKHSTSGVKLAEVYELARKYGWKPTKFEKVSKKQQWPSPEPDFD